MSCVLLDASYNPGGGGGAVLVVSGDAGNDITVGGDGGAFLDLSASGLSFGAENEIPTVNAATDGYDYSANLTFNDTTLFSVDNTPIVFNESGADVDFRVEGVGQANALFVQGSDGFVGIGTNAPNNLIQVTGLIDFDNTDFNTKIGFEAGGNIVAGAQFNVFLGYQAGLSSATLSTNAADGNVGVGYQALNSNTTGSDNVANGFKALFNNTTGLRNTANGAFALNNNTTGLRNTANGAKALFSNTAGLNNVANGYEALNNNTTGSNNVANGYGALFNNTTGIGNVANGYGAGRFIADGSTPNETSGTSVYLGRDTKALADGGANEIVIGYNATGLGSNTVVLGNSSIVTTGLRGDVGIGITSPQTNLHIQENNTDTVPATEIEQLGTGDAALQFSIPGNSYAMGIDNSDNDRFKVSYANAAGNAVLGTGDVFAASPTGYASPATAISLGAAGPTTFAVTSNVMTISADAGATIATITGGISGQILTLIFTDSNVTITDDGTATANTVNLSGPFVSAANTTLTLVFDGNSWFETSRSVN